uniref:Uncharacterized protein n=1 Tax=Anguilla anguilla TaxID=7936 RepID=A0A0E9QT26_ANGAN
MFYRTFVLFRAADSPRAAPVPGFHFQVH